MAPKGMKRPAAKASSAPVAKRTRLAPEIKAKCELVESEIMAYETLPRSVRKMLCASVKNTLPTVKESRHKVQHELVEMMGEALGDIEAKYKKDIEEHQDTVNNADANKAALIQAEKESEEELEKLKAATVAAHEPAAADNKSMLDAKAALNQSKVDQTLGDQEINQIEAKKGRLDSTMRDVFFPMKEAAATGREGQNNLKVLEKVGKEFAFDASMLDAVLAVLAKEPAARGTFDKMVEKQLEDSFVTTSANLALKLEELAPAKKERADLVSEKESVFTICDEKVKASKAALDSAVAAEALGRNTLNENKQKLSNFFPELKKASNALDFRKGALEAFKTGPMQGFLDLKELAPPPPEPEPVAVAESVAEEPTATTEAVAAQVPVTMQVEAATAGSSVHHGDAD